MKGVVFVESEQNKTKDREYSWSKKLTYKADSSGNLKNQEENKVPYVSLTVCSGTLLKLFEIKR